MKSWNTIIPDDKLKKLNNKASSRTKELVQEQIALKRHNLIIRLKLVNILKKEESYQQQKRTTSAKIEQDKLQAYVNVIKDKIRMIK